MIRPVNRERRQPLAIRTATLSKARQISLEVARSGGVRHSAAPSAVDIVRIVHIECVGARCDAEEVGIRISADVCAQSFADKEGVAGEGEIGDGSHQPIKRRGPWQRGVVVQCRVQCGVEFLENGGVGFGEVLVQICVEGGRVGRGWVSVLLGLERVVCDEDLDAFVVLSAGKQFFGQLRDISTVGGRAELEDAIEDRGLRELVGDLEVVRVEILQVCQGGPVGSREENRVRVLSLRRVGPGDVCGRLKNGLLELWRVFLSAVGGQVVQDRAASSRFAHDGDPRRITTEERGILLDPIQCLALVRESDVGDSSVRLERVTLEEPESTQLYGLACQGP